MTDQEFIAGLRLMLLADGDIEPTIPVFRKADGSIDREKTLSLPCYQDWEQPAQTSSQKGQGDDA